MEVNKQNIVTMKTRSHKDEQYTRYEIRHDTRCCKDNTTMIKRNNAIKHINTVEQNNGTTRLIMVMENIEKHYRYNKQ